MEAGARWDLIPALRGLQCRKGTRQKNNYQGNQKFTMHTGKSKHWECLHKRVERGFPSGNDKCMRLDTETAFQLALRHHLEDLADAKISLQLLARVRLLSVSITSFPYTPPSCS